MAAAYPVGTGPRKDRFVNSARKRSDPAMGVDQPQPIAAVPCTLVSVLGAPIYWLRGEVRGCFEIGRVLGNSRRVRLVVASRSEPRLEPFVSPNFYPLKWRARALSKSRCVAKHCCCYFREINYHAREARVWMYSKPL